jgi:hypothetical protein
MPWCDDAGSVFYCHLPIANLNQGVFALIPHRLVHATPGHSLPFHSFLAVFDREVFRRCSWFYYVVDLWIVLEHCLTNEYDLRSHLLAWVRAAALSNSSHVCVCVCFFSNIGFFAMFAPLFGYVTQLPFPGCAR